MDYEVRRIYKAISNFGSVDGVNEIIEDMDSLNQIVSEYKNTSMYNSYIVPTVIEELNSFNNNLQIKYDSYLKDIDVPTKNYNINVFGGADHYEKKTEEQLSKLGRVAIKKICDHYNITYNNNDINGSNQDVMNFFTRVMDIQTNEEIGDKMSFKVSFND